MPSPAWVLQAEVVGQEQEQDVPSCARGCLAGAIPQTLCRWPQAGAVATNRVCGLATLQAQPEPFPALEELKHTRVSVRDVVPGRVRKGCEDVTF